MKFDAFFKWLKETKKMNQRSARDVVSRSRRVLLLTEQSEFDLGTIACLQNSEHFANCTSSVRSQLKRSVTLYLEFLNS